MPETTPDHPASAPPGARPVLAFVVASHSPYRLHFNQRVAREIPEMHSCVLYTHGVAEVPWKQPAERDIVTVQFGPGQDNRTRWALRNAPREWRKGKRIIKWLRANRAAAVVISGYDTAGLLRIIRWCAARRVPSCMYADSNIKGDRATGLRRMIKMPVVTWAVRRIGACLVCGSLGRAYYERYGARPDRIFYVPYEPDYSLITDLPEERVAAVRERFGLPSGRRRIVFSGRLEAIKRVDLLLDAFRFIADERPEWDLVVVGDGPLRADLACRVPLRFKDRVIWTGFVDDQETISAIYRASDVLVLPSANEPWALVINEAVAAGMAVVASDVVGAAAELVRDGVNGRIMATGEVRSLIAALAHVTEPATLDSMKRAAPGVLADWRRRADPVAGLRTALAALGVLARA